MPVLVNTSSVDEQSYQWKFYDKFCVKNVNIARNTDGFQDGTIFEHKVNVMSYGLSKTLSQALIYLVRFNQDGIPVPKNICLVSQNEEKVYVFDSSDFIDIINDIHTYANVVASQGIVGFTTKIAPSVFDYKLDGGWHDKDNKKLLDFLSQDAQYTKVTINKYNVYGWSEFFYKNAKEHKQKPHKQVFFSELRNPTKTLKKYIEAWNGKETDFDLIMDLLNDPQAKKDLGAFYTPLEYAEKTTELVREAIKKVPAGNDYIILDRCAGAGALENFLSDEELSHCIVSTYEMKEWIVLKDKIGHRVRYLAPPIPDENDPEVLPQTNRLGYLCGADALTQSFLENDKIMRYVNDPDCNVIMLENPPYRDITAQDKTEIREKSYIYKKFIEAGTDQAAHREMDNLFIWSAFEYYLKKPNDSYILFSPIKYFKSLHLVDKRFEMGFLYNREHFHANKSAVSCILWSNTDEYNESVTLQAYDIIDGKVTFAKSVTAKKVYKTFNIYNDKRTFSDDAETSFAVSNSDGKPTTLASSKKAIFNDNIVGYLRATSFNLNPNSRCLTRTITKDALEQAYGFYLRKDNFELKLPLFCAKLYQPSEWYYKEVIFTTGDGGNAYENDKELLKKCLLYTCLCFENRCKSFEYENVLIQNEICLSSQNTESAKKLKSLARSVPLTDSEKELLCGFDGILEYCKSKEEYNENYNYGLRQIDDEINVNIKQSSAYGSDISVPKYGDLDIMIRGYKKLLSEYFNEEIVPLLFRYELLK